MRVRRRPSAVATARDAALRPLGPLCPLWNLRRRGGLLGLAAPTPRCGVIHFCRRSPAGRPPRGGADIDYLRLAAVISRLSEVKSDLPVTSCLVK